MSTINATGFHFEVFVINLENFKAFKATTSFS